MKRKPSYEELEKRNKLLEKRLNESLSRERLYHDLFDKSSQPLVVARADGTFRVVNDAYCALTGYSRDELLQGITWKLELTPEKWRAYEEELLERSRLTKKPVRYEKEYRKKDGTIIPVELMVFPLCNENGEVVYYYASISDISSFKSVEESLKRAKRAAEEANLAKSEFLANMSHEIRTPMNSILGFTQVLQGKVREPKLSHYLEIIYNSSKSLLSLINDILDLSRIEAGKIALEYRVCSPKLLFREMEALFSHKTREKGLEFFVDINPELPRALLLDEVRLREILVNLIGNAIKFTESGYLKLSADFHYSDQVQHSTLDFIFSVEDSGIGIPEDQQEAIFETFTQARGQNVAQYGGTGLGLAITRRLIEMMNGEISLVSIPGSGSTFSIILHQVEVSAINSSGPIKGEVFDFSKIKFEPASILIADDLDYNRELLKIFLKDFDFTFLEASNGVEVIGRAREYGPQLILLDMKMPEMDGYEAADIIKRDGQLAGTPLIAVTASALKQDEEIISSLCDSYIRKPLSKKELVRKLMQFLPYTINE